MKHLVPHRHTHYHSHNIRHPLQNLINTRIIIILTVNIEQELPYDPHKKTVCESPWLGPKIKQGREECGGREVGDRKEGRRNSCPSTLSPNPIHYITLIFTFFTMVTLASMSWLQTDGGRVVRVLAADDDSRIRDQKLTSNDCLNFHVPASGLRSPICYPSHPYFRATKGGAYHKNAPLERAHDDHQHHHTWYTSESKHHIYH